MFKSKKIENSEIQRFADPESPPKLSLALGEMRAGLDLASVPASLTISWIRKERNNKNLSKLPIILMPGFATDDRYMRPLGKHLEHLGYSTEGWGLGSNMAGSDKPHSLSQISESWNIEPYEGYTEENYRGEGGVPYLCDLATKRVKQRASELNSKIVLIGWSLGGYIAREVARELGDDVAHVITLGSPVIGGPKYTKAVRFFVAKGFNIDWIEKESLKRDNSPIQQPITAIYSKTDGVVDWRAAIDKISPNVTHWQVNAAHIGMGFNSKIWKLVRASLAEHGNLSP